MKSYPLCKKAGFNIIELSPDFSRRAVWADEVEAYLARIIPADRTALDAVNGAYLSRVRELETRLSDAEKVLSVYNELGKLWLKISSKDS